MALSRSSKALPRDHSKSFRVGIVGSGLMGRWHAHAARKAGAIVSAVVDPQTVHAAALAKKYKAQSYSSLDDLFASDTPVDVIHICSPTGTHEDLLEKTIAAKLDTIVEKPFALDAVTTARLLGKAADLGVKVCPVHQFSHQKSVQTLLAKRHGLGDLLSINFTFTTAGAAMLPEGEWKQAIADILPHPFSIIQTVFPANALTDADWVCQQSSIGSWEVSTIINSVRVQIWISVRARPTMARMDVYGSTGSFSANLFHDYAVWRADRVSRTTKLLDPFISSTLHFGTAGLNLMRRSIHGELAYPGLVDFVSSFYQASMEQLPVSHRQTLDVAEMRDWFLAQPATPIKGRRQNERD